MGSIEQFAAFLAAAVLLNLTPGADHTYILGRTIAQGRLIGFMSSWGVCTGAMFHVLAVSAGISAIIAASPTAFTIVKFAGAGYLIWLGIQALRSRGLVVPESGPRLATSPWRAFGQGVVVDVLNPKVAIFFMAFLPQFVTPSLGAAWWQLILLGGIVILVALLWEAVLVLGAHAMTASLRRRPAISRWLNRVMGMMLVALGIRLALQER